MRSKHDGDRLDAAIDAAARAMTAVEPSAALRASVRDRVGERSFVTSIFRLKSVLPISAAAAAVAAVLVASQWSSEPAPMPALPRQPLTPPVVSAADVVPALATDLRRVVATTRVPRNVAAPAPPIEEPPTIPPITIAPLETELIAVDDSGVMPIEIEPLQIEPLRGD